MKNDIYRCAIKWDLVQKPNRIPKDTNKAKQSECENLPLSDRTATELRLNPHCQPVKHSKIGVYLHTLYLPWEPLKLEAALWSSWGNNTTNTAFICLFPYSNQTLKIVRWVRLGLCFRENGVDAAKRARQEAFSSASFLAGAASRGWWPDVAEICKRCLTSCRSLPILRIAMLVYNQPCN